MSSAAGGDADADDAVDDVDVNESGRAAAAAAEVEERWRGEDFAEAVAAVTDESDAVGLRRGRALSRSGKGSGNGSGNGSRALRSLDSSSQAPFTKSETRRGSCCCR